MSYNAVKHHDRCWKTLRCFSELPRGRSPNWALDICSMSHVSFPRFGIGNFLQTRSIILRLLGSVTFIGFRKPQYARGRFSTQRNGTLKIASNSLAQMSRNQSNLAAILTWSFVDESVATVAKSSDRWMSCFRDGAHWTGTNGTSFFFILCQLWNQSQPITLLNSRHMFPMNILKYKNWKFQLGQSPASPTNSGFVPRSRWRNLRWTACHWQYRLHWHVIACHLCYFEPIVLP